MILEVKKVNKCKDGDFGYFRSVTKDKSKIVISLSKNKYLAEYGATLMHELLHFWVYMLRKEGFRVGNRKEHKFVYAAEDKILKEIKTHFKKKAA